MADQAQAAPDEQVPQLVFRNYGQAPAPTPAPSPVPETAPASPTLNFRKYEGATPGGLKFRTYDLSGTSTTPTEPPSGQSAPSEGGSLWTRSLIQDVAGSDVLETGRQKIAHAVGSLLPESMRGGFLSDFADEASKAGPGFVNFMTSPVGLGLIGAHLIPATAPFAGVGDLILGGQQALEAIPDLASAIVNPGDGRKWAHFFVDLAGAYGGLKGGARVGEALRAMPADVTMGKPMLKAYTDAFKAAAPSPPPLSTRAADLKARLDAAVPEDRADIIAEAEQPKNFRERIEQNLYRKPVVRGIVNTLVPGVQKPPVGELGQYMVDQYIKNIDTERNNAARVMDTIRRTVPAEERDVTRMGYAMEGDAPAGPVSPGGYQGIEALRQLNRERDEKSMAAGVSEDILRDPETYIRHYWDFNAPNSAVRGIATRMMNDPSFQARKIGSLKLGMAPKEEGGYALTPTYRDVTDIAFRRHMEGIRTIENQKFANTLRDYGLIVDPTKANERGSMWPHAVEAPALQRAVFSGKTDEGGITLRPKAPLVHPDIKMAVNAIFAEPWGGRGAGDTEKAVANATNQLMAFTKQIGVGLSMFHTNIISTISQAHAAGAGGLEMIPRIAKAIAWPLDPEFLRGIKDGIWNVRGRKGAAPDAPISVRLSRDSVEPWMGLSFHSSESEGAAIEAARNAFKNSEPWLKKAAAPIRAIGDVQYIFNHALFDYYLPGQMLHTAEHLYASELNRLGELATEGDKLNLRNEIIDHTNRSYGVENWQHLMITPKAAQALRATLFAPMWTLATLRTLTKGYETVAGGRLTNRYIAGGALTFFLTSQLANYAFSSWYGDPQRYPNGGGEYWDPDTQQWKRGGHLTWQNPGAPVKMGSLAGAGQDKYIPIGKDQYLSDNAFGVYFGQNDDGSARYIRLGKNWRDGFSWFLDPIQTGGSKLSLPLRQGITAATGVEPGSQYQVVNPKMSPEQQEQQRIAAVAQAVTPFSLEGLVQQGEHLASPSVFREPGATSQWLGLPTRRGTSFMKVYQDLRAAEDSNAPNSVIDQIRRAAEMNHVNFMAVRNELHAERNREKNTATGVPPTAPPPVPPQ
jgi:hypothetical protein